MAEDVSLNALARRRFLTAFGQPRAVHSEKDAEWCLAPNRHAHVINLLLNGSPNGPLVWVFDPNDPERGTETGVITDTGDVDLIITSIRARISRAANAHRDSCSGH